MAQSIAVTYSVWATSQELALAAARLFAQTACQAAAARGTARIAISGGSTPKAMFDFLADPAHPFAAEIPWDRLELFWVDERCVPPADSEPNFRMTPEHLLS